MSNDEKNSNDALSIRVILQNGEIKFYPKGTILKNIAKENSSLCAHEIVGAIVNNNLKELFKPLEKNCSIVFFDISSIYGNHFYTRSLAFLFIIAAEELFPNARVTIEHSVNKGYYCEIINGSGTENGNGSENGSGSENKFSEEDSNIIKAKMKELVERDIPFEKNEMLTPDAIALFQGLGKKDKISLMKHRTKPEVNVYRCNGYYDYFYGFMVPSTGYLKVFDLVYYSPGFILRFPERVDPKVVPQWIEQKKLFKIFREADAWGKILEMENIGHLNDAIDQGRTIELINIAEGLHEKKYAAIADIIASKRDDIRLVLIAGPSSSGKTSSAHRLSTQLRINGLKPIPISLDDFFLNREDTPTTPDGEYDFETVHALDIKTFNEVMTSLISGKETEMPSFNFHTGSREWQGKKLQVNDEHILVVEGIHGLNELLTSSIPKEQKFKIYVSALTHLGIDDHNRIPTSDLRLIRRITRDFQFRSASALKTIRMWESVRRGEDIWIYPYQEEADVMMNSSLVYELSVLKKIAMPQLALISEDVPEYIEAKRLIKFLEYFSDIDMANVPLNSILREFIGGSCFFK